MFLTLCHVRMTSRPTELLLKAKKITDAIQPAEFIYIYCERIFFSTRYRYESYRMTNRRATCSDDMRDWYVCVRIVRPHLGEVSLDGWMDLMRSYGVEVIISCVIF